MSFRFLVCVPLLFQVIIGLPLDSVNQIEVTSNVGLWDNSDLSIDQVVPGNLDGNFPLGNSGNAGYDIFASDGIGNQPQDSIFLNDVSLISADYTDKSPEFLLTEGNFLNDISETPGCTNQARKRDGDTPLQCAPGQKPNGQEPNGQKPDPGPSNEPIIPPFFVKPWTCPVGLHSMCCVGRIEDDKRAFGCSYCTTPFLISWDPEIHP